MQSSELAATRTGCFRPTQNLAATVQFRGKTAQERVMDANSFKQLFGLPGFHHALSPPLQLFLGEGLDFCYVVSEVSTMDLVTWKVSTMHWVTLTCRLAQERHIQADDWDFQMHTGGQAQEGQASPRAGPQGASLRQDIELACSLHMVMHAGSKPWTSTSTRFPVKRMGLGRRMHLLLRLRSSLVAPAAEAAQCRWPAQQGRGGCTHATRYRAKQSCCILLWGCDFEILPCLNEVKKGTTAASQDAHRPVFLFACRTAIRPVAFLEDSFLCMARQYLKKWLEYTQVSMR